MAPDRRVGLAALALVAIASPAAASMDVATLAARVTAAATSASMAGSPDYAAVVAELRTVSTDYRTQQAADRAAGRKPASCLPPVGQAKFTQEDLVQLIAGVPAAERARTSVADAFARYVARVYPCP